MEEKKLTDEEIIKALNHWIECSNGIGSIESYRYENSNTSFEHILDLIHRLQEENERLSLIAGIVDKGVAVEIVNMQETIDKQKAEIERLTEERFNLNAEIAKQKIEYEALKCGTKIVCGAREILSETIKTEIKQQAVKDTAKEIADWLDNEKGYCGLGYLVKKHFGVEVE
jgi:chorismate mutase